MSLAFSSPRPLLLAMTPGQGIAYVLEQPLSAVCESHSHSPPKLHEKLTLS
jgi:hypothetical protein